MAFTVKTNRTDYEYDIHSLVKAFFPEEDVCVVTPDTGEAKREEWLKSLRMEVKLFQNEEGGTVFSAGDGKAVCGDGAEVVFFYEDGKAPVHKFHCAESAGGDKVFKKETKRFLYEALVGETGKTLPWGNLTGIRPTKIAMGLLEEGRTPDQAQTFLEEGHFVSREKAALAVEIAEREKQILSGIHYENGYSLYIGIPFCPTTCLYCSFTSNPIVRWRERVEEYLDCLIREMRFTQEQYAGKLLDSVYIGGGTPTTLTAAQLDRLLTALREIFDFSTVQEFTVEAGRADSITRDKLEILKKHGVGRISVNPQTMKEETLRLIGRQATAAQVKEAFALAREVGGFNINMDLILGLPGEDEADVRRTMEEILLLKPDSLTVHSLAIKRASRLAQWIRENGVATIRNTDATMAIAAAGAAQMEMHPYYLYRQKNMSGNFENVGYATEGNYGIYNILIMEEKQTIVALGAGSITKRVFPDGRIERCENVKDVAQYIERIDEMIERKRSLLSGYSI